MDALCASLLPDEEINQLNFKAVLESGPKVVLIFSRRLHTIKVRRLGRLTQPIACSFFLLAPDRLAFMCRTYDFLDDSALYSSPTKRSAIAHYGFCACFLSRLSHCVSSCFHLFVCVWQCSLSSSPTEQKATYHTGWLAH